MLYPTERFPIIETERLVLREIVADDFEMMYVLRSNPDIMKYIPRPLCEDHRDALKLISTIRELQSKQECLSWAITQKNSDVLLGTVGFVRIKAEHNRAELGYLLHPAEQGKGIMREAVEAIIQYGFNTMALHSIEAIIDPDNIASEKILQHFKFEKEGHFRENFLFEGKYLDSVCYTLFNQV